MSINSNNKKIISGLLAASLGLMLSSTSFAAGTQQSGRILTPVGGISLTNGAISSTSGSNSSSSENFIILDIGYGSKVAEGQTVYTPYTPPPSGSSSTGSDSSSSGNGGTKP